VRIEESIEIARQPQEVWDIVADPQRDAEWCPKVKSVQRESDGRWRVVHKPVPLRPAIELIVDEVEADPPRRLRLREEDDAAVIEVEYRLEPNSVGTRFTQVSDVDWKRLPRVLHGTFRRGVQRDVRHQLRDLKRLLEA
jgi:carbon monoxide dehydrogenase subunit G